MKKARYPNRLKLLVKDAGLSIREVHQETGISESTLHYWAAGHGVIPKKDRSLLAQVIGCSISDLAPNHEEELPGTVDATASNELQNRKVNASGSTTREEGRIVVGVMHGKEMNSLHTSQGLYSLASKNALDLMRRADVDCFAVDDLLTLTQSNGFAGWDRDDVFVTALSAPLPVPEDIEMLRQEKLPVIQQNFVNSSHYRLAAYTPAFSDRRGLEVAIAPLGFHDFFALVPFLDELLLTSTDGTKTSVREKYGKTALTYSASSSCLIPAPISLQCVLVTNDDRIILAQRSGSVAFYPNHWSASFEETMDAPGLNSKKKTRSGDADFFTCAVRGLEEEFGISADAVESVKLLSLNVEYLILAVGVVAIIRTHLTASEVKEHWLTQAPDRNEASKLATVPTDLSSIIEKILSGDVLWHPTARMRLIQFLFHTYGVKVVVEAFKTK